MDLNAIVDLAFDCAQTIVFVELAEQHVVARHLHYLFVLANNDDWRQQLFWVHQLAGLFEMSGNQVLYFLFDF